MKKYLIVLFFTLVCRVWALPSYVEFSTQGEEKDTYADGTVVQDGEVYACVWVKSGATFAGIMANGKLVDPENNKFIGAAPLAKDGHCKPVVFMLNGENADLAEGSFEVYLLDTRASSVQGEKMVASGISSGKALEIVNSWKQAGVAGNGVDGEMKDVRGESVASVVPGDAPMPVIKSMRIFEGKVVLTIGNTVPYLRYGVSAGSVPSRMTKNYKVSGANGVGGGDLTLVIDQVEENRFFKVVRE